MDVIRLAKLVILISLGTSPAIAGHVFNCSSEDGYVSLAGGEFGNAIWIDKLVLGEMPVENFEVTGDYFSSRSLMFAVRKPDMGAEIIRIEAVSAQTLVDGVEDDFISSGLVWINKLQKVVPMVCRFSF